MTTPEHDDQATTFTLTTGAADAELRVIYGCWQLLSMLDAETRRRVVRYLGDRLVSVPEGQR